MGHTMSIHSKNEDVILQFGLRKPAFRICVNTPTTHGSIGLTTGLDPAMTLGCGGWGGNITSDNISPRHLLNIKRLAYEVRPAQLSATMAAGQAAGSAPLPPRPEPVPLPKVAAAAVPRGISAQTLASRIDAFLASRGYKPAEAGGPAPTSPRPAAPQPSALPSPAPAASSTPSQPEPSAAPADFVCEDDVRAALKAGRKLVIGERSIVTPSARDLGEAQHVFIQAGWPH